MISIMIEFKTLQDLRDTLGRMNITDVIVAPDNECLIQISVTRAQYQELQQLDCVTLIDEM